MNDFRAMKMAFISDHTHVYLVLMVLKIIIGLAWCFCILFSSVPLYVVHFFAACTVIKTIISAT